MPGTVRPSVVVVFAALAALLMALVPATAAQAHTDLRSSTPAEGETVAALDEVSLQFTGALLDIGAELSLVDAEGTTTALEPTFPADDTVAAAVDTDLAAGEAQLVWRIVAEDGHPIEGVIDFTVAPDGAAPSMSPSGEASVAPVPSPTDTPTESASGSPTPEATSEPSVSPAITAVADAGTDSATAPWLWWLVGAVVVAGGATAVAIAVRRRPTP